VYLCSVESNTSETGSRRMLQMYTCCLHEYANCTVFHSTIKLI